MSMMKFRGGTRLFSVALFIAILTGCDTPGTAFVALTFDASFRVTAQTGQSLSEDGDRELHSLIASRTLSDLEDPDFDSYQSEVREFYDAFPDGLPWIQHSKPTSQALALIELFQTAEAKGLNPEDYDGSKWKQRIASLQGARPPNERAFIRFDLALTISAMRYTSDLHIGRVNPRQVHFALDVDNRDFDLSEFLRRQLVASSDVREAVEAVEPPFPTYRRTLEALSRYLELARRGEIAPLPVPRHLVKPGEFYAALPRLARLLRRVGDLPVEVHELDAGHIYKGASVDAIKRFQERHGLDPSGDIDARTFEELNTPLHRRVTQLQLTLERWRWLPRAHVKESIIVNIPEFRLRAVDEDYRWVLSMKVVVGRAYRDQTPVFSSDMKSVIFRPYWNVPLPIQRDELLPEIEKDPAYFVKNSYEIVDARGAVIGDGIPSDEILQQLRSETLTIRQRPGPENALGLVKFDLPNPFDIYLHSTPAAELFARSRRDFSHGCIRVEDAVALAKWVLRDQPEWTEAEIRAAMNGDKTFAVKLIKPIPVLIVYGTAVVMENGEVHFFDDIYGHDAALERVLANRSLSSD